jgi:ketosteroid isomerase-like protein
MQCILSSVVLVLALCSACNRAPEQARTVNVGAVRAQLDSMWAGLSRVMTVGDTAAVAAFYTDSAYFAETGQPTLRGKAAIRAATARLFACCRYLESRLQPELTELTGGRAFQFGIYRDVIQPAGRPPITLYGRLHAVLDRDRTGAWRISRLVVIRDSSDAHAGSPR